MMGSGTGSHEEARVKSSSLGAGGLGPGGRIATSFLSAAGLELDLRSSVTLMVRQGLDGLLESTELGGILLPPMDHAPSMFVYDETPIFVRL